jgi:hypothetical protein
LSFLFIVLVSFFFFLYFFPVQNVIDHYENPRNVGTLDQKSDNVGTGLVGAPACGDVMKLQIRVDDDGKIVDVKQKTCLNLFAFVYSLIAPFSLLLPQSVVEVLSPQAPSFPRW